MKTFVAVLAFLGVAVHALPQNPGIPGVLYNDGDCEYMVAMTGDRIPVYRQPATNITIPTSRLTKRQSTTFTPPDSCITSQFGCTSLAGSGSLKATCVDCATGFGNGSPASPTIDCTNSGAVCPITLTNSVTTTDTISADISFGATIGDTGETGAQGTASFSLGVSFSTAVTRGSTLGLSIPQGKAGYVQYQPAAVLGTVVTSQVTQNFCNGVAQNKICGAAPGILATSKDDSTGKYSIVLTS